MPNQPYQDPYKYHQAIGGNTLLCAMNMRLKSAVHCDMALNCTIMGAISLQGVDFFDARSEPRTSNSGAVGEDNLSQETNEGLESSLEDRLKYHNRIVTDKVDKVQANI